MFVSASMAQCGSGDEYGSATVAPSTHFSILQLSTGSQVLLTLVISALCARYLLHGEPRTTPPIKLVSAKVQRGRLRRSCSSLVPLEGHQLQGGLT